jgi:hypothetical protein
MVQLHNPREASDIQEVVAVVESQLDRLASRSRAVPQRRAKASAHRGIRRVGGPSLWRPVTSASSGNGSGRSPRGTIPWERVGGV